MKRMTAGLAGVAFAAMGASSATAAASVCLITKDATNPFL